MTPLLVAAFAAGMVSTANPCGFAMLPAYLGLFIGDADAGRRSPLVVGMSVSVGFVAVFLVVGLLVGSGIRIVIGWVPWLAAVVGLGLVAIGVGRLRGTDLLPRIPGVRRAPQSRSFSGMVGFGVSYGVASLSCTLPVFLSLIAGSVAGRSYLESVSVFLVYGAGMSLVVIAFTLAIGVGRDRVLRVARPISTRLGTISGWVLIGAGVFIVWYWATVLAAGGVGLTDNPVVRVIERWTAGIAGVVSTHPVVSGGVLVVLALLAWWALRRISSRSNRGRLSPVELIDPPRT